MREQPTICPPEKEPFCVKRTCERIARWSASARKVFTCGFLAASVVQTGWALGLAEAPRRSFVPDVDHVRMRSFEGQRVDAMTISLREWQEKLDQDITRAEQLIAQMRSMYADEHPGRLHGPFSETVVQESQLPVEPTIQDATPANQENFAERQEDIQILDETLVQSTPLDPFDDKNSEPVYDPWETFNASMFSFNHSVDRYVLRPIAWGYDNVLPDPLQLAVGRAIDNVRVVRRLLNNLLQGKFQEAGVELGRFLINSTVGFAGFFDVAQDQLDLAAPPEEDTGQTLGVHGVRPGPYVILPLLPPMTVRDGVGLLGDVLLDPLSYVLPFSPQASIRGTEIVNDRAQHLELFEGVEQSTLDLYGAVRSAYFQRRAKAIQDQMPN